MPGPSPRDDTERAAHFWSRVDKGAGPDACWLWTGGTTSAGYGQIKLSDSMEKTHRFAFFLANGWMPKGRGRGCLIVRHTCDVRRCCNPAHLIAGSYRENSMDCVERGRHARARMPGFSNPQSKLTPPMIAKAQRLRAEGRTMREIGGALGVSQSSASRLLAGRTYAGERAS